MDTGIVINKYSAVQGISVDCINGLIKYWIKEYSKYCIEIDAPRGAGEAPRLMFLSRVRHAPLLMPPYLEG